MTATSHLPLFAWSDICSARHKGNEQSAAANLVTDKARDRLRILAFLKTVEDSTCEEASLATGISYQTCSGRFSELKAAGLIAPGSGKRRTRSGCNAQTWKLRMI